EARKKKRKKRAAPRTPSGSPLSSPLPLPPPAGTSGTPGISGTLGSSQFPPPPPLPSTGASGSAQQAGSEALSLSKPAASTHQSMAWTTSDTRFELTGFTAAQELSPTDSLMQDDSILDEHVHLSDDKDSENDHLPKADSRQDWWKPLHEEERPATPEPAWTIPSSNVSNNENYWASTLVSTYETPAENSLLAKTGDMMTFMKWYCRQFQMEECHKMFTDQIDWTNPEGEQVRVDVNQPLPLGGPSVQNMASLTSGLIDRSSILTDMILRRVEKIAEFQEHTIAEKDFKNMYPSDFKDLNLLLLQGNLDHLPGSDKRMLSTAVKLWTRNLVIRQQVEDFQLGIESYQTQLNLTKPGWDATGYEFKHDYTIIESPRAVVFPVNNNERKIMRFNKIYKFSDGTLTRILEALDYRVKEFKVKRLNPGMNTRFWTKKDVTRSKEFIAAIERRLKTRRIYQNLECFVGGRVHDIDYRLLQRTE
ncbi:hypothetical protein Tco_0525985, partial [Tanacetum coccineum]